MNIHILIRDVYLRRFLAAAIVLGFALGLAACGGGSSTGASTGSGDRGSQFADYVADHWPRWAGGMPEDVPPRPGAPGYNEFVAHGQTNLAPAPSAAAAGPPAKTAATKTKTIAQPAPAAAAAPVEPVAEEPAEDSSVVKGGLY